MKICITGGAGYVGSALVPFLMAKGHEVTVIDTFWYGDYLPSPSIQLHKIKGDIRSSPDLRSAFRGQDAVIHMACVSNDPSFDMNKTLGESINHLAFRNIIDIVKEQRINKFIYASSSSVYGVSELDQVTEGAPKAPLTDYSKYKLQCEIELQMVGTGGSWTIIRPATVCGYAPRMRLDLVVNILTIQAIIDKQITIFGTKQKRPNINIQDMCQAYDFVLNNDVCDQQIYNVGFENLALLQIAKVVRDTLGSHIVNIVEKPVNDPRSYHINSQKIVDHGFKPLHTVEEAISSIYKHRKLLLNPMENPTYYNIKRMKELGL